MRDLDRTIDEVEAKFRSHILGPAQLLASQGGPDAGTAILMLLIAYFERLGQWLPGSGPSGQDRFRAGFAHVYLGLAPALRSQGITAPNAVEQVADLLYVDARCGLYHEVATRPRLIVGPIAPVEENRTLLFDFDIVDRDNPPPGPYTLKRVLINPWALLPKISDQFRDYVGQLRDPAETSLRASFDAAMS